MTVPPLRSIVLAALAALATSDLAEAQGRRGRDRFRMPPSPIVEALDLDGDGALSADEMDDAIRSLRTLDKDGDGNLSAEELQPDFGDRGRRGGGPGGPPGFGGPPGMGMGMDPVLAAIDKDGDGALFLDEITDAARALDRLDVDRDDVVSAEELRPRRGGGPGGFGGRGGFPGGGFGGRGGERPYDTVPRPDQLLPEHGVADVPDRAAFARLSYRGEEVMVDTHLADLEFVKFQIEDAGGDDPRLYFMNTKNLRAHPMFMQLIGVGGRGGEADGQGERMRGVLVYRPRLLAPDGSAGLYTFEFEPNDAYSYDMIRIAYDMLVEHGPVFRGRLSYNLLPRARQRWQTEQERYVEGQLPVFHPDDVYGDVGFQPLHQAVGFGRLRLMEPGERPGPRDVVVYRTLPNEMPRVAGVLTSCRQTPLSHVNLRAVQDDVPNAFAVGVADAAEVKALLGRYVRLAVTDAAYELREATAAEVDEHFAALRPAAAQTPPRDLEVREIRPLSSIGFGDADAFGVKASNLGVLRSLDLGDAVTPAGYAVPFAHYDAFMRHNDFYEAAAKMMADERFRSDADAREEALKELRKAIKKGAMPDWVDASLAEVQARFAGASFRCRSSTNNEDLPGFSGAGLYDSFTHKPDEGHLRKSIRQVYASMWNFRAFEEREFFRVDHLQAAMGVALHPNEKDEQVNGVAVTRDVLHQELHKGMLLYYVNAQVGEDLVTNPDAESVPEELLLAPRNPKNDRVLQRSSAAAAEADAPDGGSLLTAAQRDTLRHALRRLHDRFARLYGKVDDPGFAMEVEFKVTSDGELQVKQARPWVDRAK